MTLKEALDTIAKYCKQRSCENCPLKAEVHPEENFKYSICQLLRESPEDYDKIPIVETNLYDKRTVVENATVEILENTSTGETSIGWWKND